MALPLPREYRFNKYSLSQTNERTFQGAFIGLFFLLVESDCVLLEQINFFGFRYANSVFPLLIEN